MRLSRKISLIMITEKKHIPKKNTSREGVRHIIMFTQALQIQRMKASAYISISKRTADIPSELQVMYINKFQYITD